PTDVGYAEKFGVRFGEAENLDCVLLLDLPSLFVAKIRSDHSQPWKRDCLFGRRPQQCILRVGSDKLRVNASQAERINQGGAITEIVVPHQIMIGSNERSQIVSEGDVDGRAIIKRSNTKRFKVSRRLARRIGQAAQKIRVQI